MLNADTPTERRFKISKHGISALQISDLNAVIHRLEEGAAPSTPNEEKTRKC